MSQLSKKINKLVQAEVKAIVVALSEKYDFDAEEAATFLADKASKPSIKLKKPPSAYIMFCKDERSKIKDDHPDFSGPQILSELGKRWKSLDSEQKMIYTKDYETAMQLYKQNALAN